jgi:sulfatase maturation enzyme AslB (radical SAM superfamily)
MRLHWIGPASFFVEAGGSSVLVDPILGGSDRRVRWDQMPAPDVLVITSRRPGRFDVASLAALPRDVEVLLGDDPALADCLGELGYARVSRCRPFEERSVGSTLLSITPSRSPWDSGLLINDASGVLWSIADLVVDEPVVDQVRARWPTIDVLVAAWRPRAPGGALGSVDARLSRYREHLATLTRIRPRRIVPWGDAAASPPPVSMFPVLEVPVSRERFHVDSTPLLARCGGSVVCLDPGDVLVVEPRPGAGESGAAGSGGLPRAVASPFVDRASDEAPAPAPPGAPPIGAEHPLLSIVTREVEEVLAASFRRGVGSVFAEHARTSIVYQLEVVLGAERRLWSFDFGALEDGVATVTLTRGADPRANFLTAIVAEDIVGLSQGWLDWSAVVSGGGYGSCQSCYATTEDGLVRLTELEDPIALHHDSGRSFLRVKEREVEAERARWASRLLLRLDSLGEPDGDSLDAGPPIAVIVTEEHNEAFLVWHAAVRHGLLPARGNVLLHVDQHSDMKAPRFHRPLPEIGADLAEITRFTYQELDIESFIVPACLQGFFDRIEWLQRDEPPATWRFCVTSLRGEREVLATRKQAPGGDEPPVEGPWLTWITRGLDGPAPEPPAAGAGTVLGIDLDYFSCDEALNRRASVEISRAELESFENDPYHALRLGSRFRSRVEDGRCFLDFNCFDEELVSPRRSTEAEYASRVRDLVEFLSRNRLRPQLIHITRSRRSGFTPADQWQRIEDLLLGGLHSLYDLRMTSIEALRRQVDLREGADQAGGARPKIRSATLPVVADTSFPSHLDFPGGRMLLIPTGCNSRCSFCMVDQFIETNDHHGRPRGEAPLSAELRALIEELPPGHLVDFFGAEPTLHESFFALLQAAAERGLEITLATNARVFSSLAYTRRVAALAGPDQLVVRTSILGATAEVHDAISRAPGSFDQMRRGVRNLREAGYDVRFNLVLTRENVHQVEDTARVGIELGAKSMKISGLVDLDRNLGSFVPYPETADAVEAFCRVCEQSQVPYEIEKLPLCVAPRRMHHFVFEQGIFPTDRGLATAPGQPCRHCVVRNVCYGVEPAFVDAFGTAGLETVRAVPEEARTPVEEILERRADPPLYRVAFTRVADRELSFEAWAELLRFKQRCEGEVGDLCVERSATG